MFPLHLRHIPQLLCLSLLGLKPSPPSPTKPQTADPWSFAGPPLSPLAGKALPPSPLPRPKFDKPGAD